LTLTRQSTSISKEHQSFTLPSNFTLVSDVQKSNALSPIFVTLLGMTTLVSDLQLSNALSPISVTLLGITTLVSNLQSLNALSPIFVTPSGMVTLVSVFSLPSYLINVHPSSLNREFK
jgi:ABC-type uncharacterized transport system permease subunit